MTKLLRSLVIGRRFVNIQIEKIEINVDININLLDFSLFSFSLIGIGFYIYIIPFLSLKLAKFLTFVIKKLIGKVGNKPRKVRARNGKVFGVVEIKSKLSEKLVSRTVLPEVRETPKGFEKKNLKSSADEGGR